MNSILEKLEDLHKQATTDRSHYYVASCCKDAIGHIKYLQDTLAAVIDGRNTAIDAWVERATEAEGIVERARLALTPSSVTKAALLGEFKFNEERFDGMGESYVVDVTVPWTTIKDNMLALAKLAGVPSKG